MCDSDHTSSGLTFPPQVWPEQLQLHHFLTLDDLWPKADDRPKQKTHKACWEAVTRRCALFISGSVTSCDTKSLHVIQASTKMTRIMWCFDQPVWIFPFQISRLKLRDATSQTQVQFPPPSYFCMHWDTGHPYKHTTECNVCYYVLAQTHFELQIVLKSVSDICSEDFRLLRVSVTDVTSNKTRRGTKHTLTHTFAQRVAPNPAEDWWTDRWWAVLPALRLIRAGGLWLRAAAPLAATPRPPSEWRGCHGDQGALA